MKATVAVHTKAVNQKTRSAKRLAVAKAAETAKKKAKKVVQAKHSSRQRKLAVLKPRAVAAGLSSARVSAF